MPNKTYEIERPAASKLLKVSTRTLDRYLRLGRLTARKSRGRVLLSREEILDLKKGIPHDYLPAPETNGEIPVTHTSSKKIIKPHTDDVQFYKDLYGESLKILEEKERKLEQSQYRIGQLESQAMSHLPLKTHTEGSGEFASHLLRQDLVTAEKTLQQTQQQLRREKLNRTIITAVLYAILILQPVLWYLLRQGQNF